MTKETNHSNDTSNVEDATKERNLLLILLAIVAMLATIFVFVPDGQRITNVNEICTPATGRIVDMKMVEWSTRGRHNTRYKPVIEYEDANGVTHQAEFIGTYYGSYDAPPVGTTTEIAYSSKSPDGTCIVKGADIGFCKSPSVLSVIMILMLAFMAFKALSATRRCKQKEDSFWTSDNNSCTSPFRKFHTYAKARLRYMLGMDDDEKQNKTRHRKTSHKKGHTTTAQMKTSSDEAPNESTPEHELETTEKKSKKRLLARIPKWAYIAIALSLSPCIIGIANTHIPSQTVSDLYNLSTTTDAVVIEENIALYEKSGMLNRLMPQLGSKPAFSCMAADGTVCRLVSSYDGYLPGTYPVGTHVTVAYDPRTPNGQCVVASDAPKLAQAPENNNLKTVMIFVMVIALCAFKAYKWLTRT